MGIMLINIGMHQITGHDVYVSSSYFGPWFKYPIPAWTGWIHLPFGIIICIITINALWRDRGKPKPKEYTDEDIARFKEELDHMYFREHGKWPVKPPPDKPSPKKISIKTIPSFKKTQRITLRVFINNQKIRQGLAFILGCIVLYIAILQLSITPSTLVFFIFIITPLVFLYGLAKFTQGLMEIL
jgi:hypothetical protein